MISLSSPLHVGIYNNNHLIKQYETKEQTSEVLPTLFKEILESFTCKRLFFAKGPGSFMAIKISYVFLKTLSISLNAPLYACDGFAFNANRPIRAMRNLYFIKENEQIITQRFDEEIEQVFHLPDYLDATKFDENTDPLYMLPAV